MRKRILWTTVPALLLAAAIGIQMAGPGVSAQQAMTPTPAATGTTTPAAPGMPGLPPDDLGWGVEGVATPGGDLGMDVEIALMQVADGLIDPVAVTSAPDDSGRLFVVERHGVVRIVQDGEVLEEPFLDISDMVLAAFLEQGMYDIEFHPDYATNGRFFVHFAELLRNGDGLVVEYAVSEDDPNVADPESARLIMQIEQPWANHNGGELAFGPDGYLYIGSGDGGWEGDPLGAGQDLQTVLGKLLRIDVDAVGQGRRYGIPEDNPFAEPPGLVQLFEIPEQVVAGIHEGAAPEIYHYGLRNPWRFHFDPETGDLWLPDVGQNQWEEINFVPAGSPAGLNFGWKFNMGTHCFPIEDETCPMVGIPPAAEYSHELGCAVMGLGVYRGPDFDEAMQGVYLVGDYCSGTIWGIARDGEAGFVMQELAQTGMMLTGGGADQEGNLYVTSCECTYGGPLPQENPPGALWQIVPADELPAGGTPSPTTGAAMTPGAGTPTAMPSPGAGTGTPAATMAATPMGTPTPTMAAGAGTPTAGATTGTPQAGGAGGEDVLAMGEELFVFNCSGCHQTDGQGIAGFAPALDGHEVVNDPDPDDAIEQVLEGGGGMPPFESLLEDEEIAAVLSYVRSAWSNDAPAVEPEEVAMHRED